jgi:transposase
MTRTTQEKLPDTVSACHEFIRHLTALNEEMSDQLKKNSIMIEGLQHQLNRLMKWRFGRSSEKLGADIPYLFPDMEEENTSDNNSPEEPPVENTDSDKRKPRRKSSSGRRKIPDHFPREEKLYDIPESDKTCGCGSEKTLIGREIHEQYEYVPATLHAIRHIRLKYACPNKCDGSVVIADRPTQAVPKSIAAEGLLSKIVTDKREFHIPMHRQIRMWRQHRWEVSESTLCDLEMSVARAFTPIYAIMRRRVLKNRILHADETPVKYIDKSVKGKSRRGYVWYYGNGGDVVYDFTTGRGRDGPNSFLENFNGTLLVDKYTGYDVVCKRENVIRAGCMAHARRQFNDSPGPHDLKLEAMSFIRELYVVEKTAKEHAGRLHSEWLENHPGAEKSGIESNRKMNLLRCRSFYRQKDSAIVLNRFRKFLEANLKSSRPSSPFGKAVAYTLDYWTELTEFVFDPELDIDNNHAERLMRPFAIGRKNWLFAGSEKAGRSAAVLYSIIETCKLNGIVPFEYIRDVLQRIAEYPADRLEELLPHNWRPLPE